MILLIVCCASILGMCAGYGLAYVIIRANDRRHEVRAEREYQSEREVLRRFSEQFGLGFDETRSNSVNRYRIEMRIKYPSPVRSAVDRIVGQGFN